MLSIIINGTNQFLAKATHLQLEMKNAAFDTERIEGDIVYTFDLPVEGNEVVFSHAQYVYVHRMKKYLCTVSVGGFEIAEGELFIQKATRKTYSCAVVMNPLPKGFADRKLKNNDYGDDLIVATGYENHDNGWSSLIRNSFEETVYPVRFPMFYNEKAFGSENEGFSSLINDIELTNVGGSLVINMSLNDSTHITKYCMCPAFHIKWLIEKVIQNAGFRLCGNFTKDSFVQSVIYLSLRSMDFDPYDYEDITINADRYVENNGNLNFISDNDTLLVFDSGVTIPWSGMFSLNFNLSVQGPFLIKRKEETYYPIQGGSYTRYEYDGVVFLVVDDEFDVQNIGQLIFNGDGTHVLYCYDVPTYYNQNNLIPIYMGQSMELQNGAHYNIKLVKYHFWWMGQTQTIESLSVEDVIPSILSAEALFVAYMQQNHFQFINLFSSKLHYAKYQPDLTNGELINTFCNIFGLSFFIDSKTKTVELSFFKDLLQAQSIDLSDYVLPGETEIEEQVVTSYSYAFKTEGESAFDDSAFLGNFNSKNNLPGADAAIGKIAYVRDENCFYKTERTTVNGQYQYNWVFSSGNTQPSVIGNDSETDVETLEIKAVVPPTIKNQNNYYARINEEVSSDIFLKGTEPFDLILLKYFGVRSNRIFANPVDPAQSTPTDIELTAKGDYSVGELYAKPWLQFIGNYEPVTCKFLLPLHVFLDVIRLLKPQDESPAQQTRWIYAENSRMMPIQMNFEFGTGEMILAEIKMAKPIVQV
ncbi:MAG: hypothetical protein PHR53_00900 [Bacteroidales bacterium]|nr:hypothetical protein [Bacteroidales bacterium]